MAMEGFAEVIAKLSSLLTELTQKTEPADVQTVALDAPDTSTRSQVADTASDALLLAANASRLGASVFNDSSAVLYLGLGTTTVSTSNYTTKVVAGALYEVPERFTGQIRGLWASDPGDGGAKVSELT